MTCLTPSGGAVPPEAGGTLGGGEDGIVIGRGTYYARRAMLSFRAASALALFALLNTKLVTCRSPGEGSADASPTRSETKDVNLPGADTSSLTAREKSEWSRFVSELRSPCPDQPVSLAQCVSESRACRACLPAAKALAKQVQRGELLPIYFVKLRRSGERKEQILAVAKHSRFKRDAVLLDTDLNR